MVTRNPEFDRLVAAWPLLDDREIDMIMLVVGMAEQLDANRR